MRLTLAVTLVFVLGSALAAAQSRSLNGRYFGEGDPNIILLVEMVPFNDGDSLTVIAGDRELHAFRKSGGGAFLYSKDGCAMSFTPQRTRGRQQLVVEATDECIRHTGSGLSGWYMKR